VFEGALLELTAHLAIPLLRLNVFVHNCPHALLPVGAPATIRDGRLQLT